MAGKGDRDRTKDFKTYRENFEKIFGTKDEPKGSTEEENGLL